MSKKFLTSIDLTLNEIQNAKLQILGSDPSSPVEGQFWYNSTGDVFKYQDATATRTLGYTGSTTPSTQASGDSASNGSSVEVARVDHKHAMPSTATSSVPGFMSAADKTKCDDATAAANVSTLMMRDSAGRASVTDPNISTDIATKNYVDNRTPNVTTSINGLMLSTDKTKLDASTSLATSSVLMLRDSSGRVQVTDPLANADVATKNYVDTRTPTASSGVTGLMPGSDKTKIDAATSLNTVSTLMMRDSSGRAQVVDPAAAQDIATKAYVDSTAQGLDAKPSCRVATTGNITLSNTQTIDGVAVIVGDRVLVKAQTNVYENGIYVVAAGSWSRALDMDAWTEVPGAFTFVESGTSLADTGWVCTADAGGTLNTTSITWVQFSSAGSFSASNDPGVTGTGVYDNTTGSQFRFRGIKANSTKVSIGLSTKDITVDVTESNLTLSNMGGTLTVAKGGTGATTASAARTNLGATTKYSSNVGNGSLTSIPVVHNLGTQDVIVQLRDNSSPYGVVECDINITDTNTVTLVFAVAPTSNQYRVNIIG